MLLVIDNVIKDLKIHPAPDTTGLRPGHIKCIFRGRKGPLSAEVRCRTLIDSLIHNIMSDPERFGMRICGHTSLVENSLC